MRAYSAASEEALQARNLLKDWAGEGFISDAQYQSLEQETVCDLRRTNIFLRLVLFLFTLIIVGAAVALFFVTARPGTEGIGVLLMVFAVVCYLSAQFSVSQARLYRYGIEEALLICSVGMLSGGIYVAFNGHVLSAATGVAASLWIWHRFGLPYASLGAMIFAAWLSTYWTSSHAAQHVIVAALYAAGLAVVMLIRRRHRFTYLDTEYSIAEALLWAGIYLAINLQLSSVNGLGRWWDDARNAAEFSKTFYWSTWVLIWCLPPAALARGLHQKDRLVIGAGAITGVLTLVTNKPYLGWERHTWDAMLLGALLIGVALLIRRWLAAGPGEIRWGFTAKRLSGKDKAWLNAGITGFGVVAPEMITPPSGSHEPLFGGGDSGGGGASSDF